MRLPALYIGQKFRSRCRRIKSSIAVTANEFCKPLLFECVVTYKIPNLLAKCVVVSALQNPEICLVMWLKLPTKHGV